MNSRTIILRAIVLQIILHSQEVVNVLDLAKRKSLMKAFITSQFNYCRLIWMFHSRQSNNRINKIHERALRLVYKDNKLTFNDLLELHI